MNKIVKYLIILSILGVAGFIFYNKVYVFKTTYSTTSPKIGDLSIEVFGIGNVDAKDIYKINAQTAGKIISIFTDEGKWVKKGELLVSIDSVDLPDLLLEAQLMVKKSISELQRLKKESQTLSAQKNLAEITYKRYKNLLEQSFVSESEYDKVKLDLDSLTTQLEAINVQIQSSQIEVKRTQTKVDSIQTKLSRFNIYSPVDGYVISKESELAQSVNASDVILKIVDPKTLWISAYIDERISGKVKVGQKTNITLRSKSGEVFSGVVKRIVAQSDALTQEREINVMFDEIPIPFYINEQARVSVVVENISKALKIPLKTLTTYNEKEGVWIVQDNTAHFKALDIQAKGDGEAAIREGLNADDIVLVPNASKKTLSEGMRVHQ
jgi:RND family efflux transporter MFP subunit